MNRFLFINITFLLFLVSCDGDDAGPFDEWTFDVGRRSANLVRADSHGNLYFAGHTLNCEGLTKVAFLSKLDKRANQVWFQEIDHDLTGEPFDLEIDSQDNVFISGKLDSDAFVFKYDDSGNVLWSSQFGSESGVDIATGICLLSENELIVIVDTVSILENQGLEYPNLLIKKYNADDGVTIWSRPFGTNHEEHFNDVFCSREGSIYAAGSTHDAFQNQTKTGEYDSFLVKFNGAGERLWVRQFGFPDTGSEARGVIVDNENNIYVTGHVENDLSLLGMDYSAYINKYSNGGELLWAQNDLAGIGINSMIPDEEGIYIYGSIGWGHFLIGGIFLAKFDHEGVELWRDITDYEGWGLDIDIDQYGAIYLSGGSWTDLLDRNENMSACGIYSIIKKATPQITSSWGF